MYWYTGENDDGMFQSVALEMATLTAEETADSFGGDAPSRALTVYE